MVKIETKYNCKSLKKTVKSLPLEFTVNKERKEGRRKDGKEEGKRRKEGREKGRREKEIKKMKEKEKRRMHKRNITATYQIFYFLRRI